jgi:hypothetical protein
MGLLVKAILFCIFLVLQSLFINGVHYCFEKGNVFYNINPAFFEKNKKKWWAYPLWSCVRCQSSVWGTATFWVAVIYIFGFHPIEIYIYVMDIFILVTLNWIIYKKL